MRVFQRVARGVAICGLLFGAMVPLAAQDVNSSQAQLRGPAPAGQEDPGEPWREALVAIPVAAALGAALAFRPIRRGTPPRDPAVIQTQIVLSVIGAIIMLVVGASLARAFGIVGAASLVRYRAKIDDPKDAAVMLGALAIGLAAGVGIYLTAAIGTTFVLLILWALESFEPVPKRTFLLKISGKEVDEMRGGVEKLLRENRIRFDLRTGGQEELAYDVELPVKKRTERLTDAILALDSEDVATVEWSQGKKK
jgi:hypothetical protein